MNIVKLGLFELKVGDVLLFRTMGRIPSTAVVAGQWMFSRNDHDGRSSTIHAAIYADNEFVLEADGPGGLAYTRLTEKKPYLCQVYRYEDPEPGRPRRVCCGELRPGEKAEQQLRQVFLGEGLRFVLRAL